MREVFNGLTSQPWCVIFYIGHLANRASFIEPFLFIYIARIAS